MVRALRMSITLVAKGDVMSSTELASAEQAIVDEVPKQLLIGGEWRDARGGATLAVDDPSTGDVLCEIADGNVEDGLDALGAADAMQKEWQQYPPREGGEILRRSWEMITARLDELALLMTLQRGKPLVG